MSQRVEQLFIEIVGDLGDLGRYSLLVKLPAPFDIVSQQIIEIPVLSSGSNLGFVV